MRRNGRHKSSPSFIRDVRRALASFAAALALLLLVGCAGAVGGGNSPPPPPPPPPKITVSIAPKSASVLLGNTVDFTATVSGTSNTGVTWSVNGVANGNATVGEVCVSASNPCVSPSGATAGAVDFLAP